MKGSKKMEKATIFDYARMCKSCKTCDDCPLYDKGCDITEMNGSELEAANEIILDWCKEHPVKTRQDKFLEMFPNVIKSNGIIDICPLIVEIGHECLCDTEPITDCCDCRKSYWLTEVEE